jgi:hypothetical protein
MTIQLLALYIINAVIALLALLAVFAPHKKMGGFAHPFVEDVTEEDEVVFIEDEDEDTLPFIRLPWLQTSYQPPPEMDDNETTPVFIPMPWVQIKSQPPRAS